MRNRAKESGASVRNRARTAITTGLAPSGCPDGTLCFTKIKILVKQLILVLILGSRPPPPPPALLYSHASLPIPIPTAIPIGRHRAEVAFWIPTQAGGCPQQCGCLLVIAQGSRARGQEALPQANRANHQGLVPTTPPSRRRRRDHHTMASCQNPPSRRRSRGQGPGYHNAQRAFSPAE